MSSPLAVQSNLSINATSSAFSNPNTKGNSIVVVAFLQNDEAATMASIQDTQGNAYALVQNASSSGWEEYVYVNVWLAQNIKAGANTVEVTPPVGNTGLTIAILEYPFIFTASPYDGGNISAPLDGTTYSIGLGSKTTQAPDLLIAYADSNSLSLAFTAGSGFVIEAEAFNATWRAFCVEDMVLTSESTPTATISTASSEGYIGVLALKIDPPVIETTSLPDAEYNQPYSQTLEATSGVLPYTWSIVSGSLPNGLSLNDSTGVISGTPTVMGTFAFTVQVTDSASPANVVSSPLSINVVTGPQYGGWDEYQRVLLQRRF